MNAYRIMFGPRAGKDLKGIYEYIAPDSSNAAAVVGRILDGFESLIQFPHRMALATHNNTSAKSSSYAETTLAPSRMAYFPVSASRAIFPVVFAAIYP